MANGAPLRTEQQPVADWKTLAAALGVVIMGLCGLLSAVVSASYRWEMEALRRDITENKAAFTANRTEIAQMREADAKASLKLTALETRLDSLDKLEVLTAKIAREIEARSNGSPGRR